MPQAGVIYACSVSGGFLRQGEIVSSVIRARLTLESVRDQTQTTVIPEQYPWAIVAAQDCDLEWDYKARKMEAPAQKLIPNILFFEMSSQAEMRMRTGANYKEWKKIRDNSDERYHILPRSSRD